MDTVDIDLVLNLYNILIAGINKGSGQTTILKYCLTSFGLGTRFTNNTLQFCVSPLIVVGVTQA